eukprot:5883276-Amphidinium_carterae.1
MHDPGDNHPSFSHSVGGEARSSLRQCFLESLKIGTLMWNVPFGMLGGRSYCLLLATSARRRTV